ncbi:MAG: sulfatase-like hydrolase/transferase [Eubacterium sp.]|nr:sulfatase-like hydrolase/transferase [Eubacterium sp.]
MDKDNKKSKKIKVLTTILKYAFTFILIILASIRNNESLYFFEGLLEVLIIFVLSNYILKNKAGYIVNSILLLLVNFQMLVLIFGNTLLTMVMITNVISIKDISGKSTIYITAVLLVILFSFLPFERLTLLKNKAMSVFAIILSADLLFVMLFGNSYSPLYGYISLMIQRYEYIGLKREIEQSETGESQFYREEVKDEYSFDFRSRNSLMPEKPNVILIFAEGLSQSIVDDEREIMPTVNYYQNHSLSFTNYYNHTFATYRGIIGQLYSGYQLADLDTNSLVSVQSILSEEGYNTAFINTEPSNYEFSMYLENLKFDTVISENTENNNGAIGSISDKDAFELLFNTAVEYNEKDKPFFISMYSFGTHASFDSPDEKFGDGTDPELNKFYNLDCQFHEFVNNLSKSDLANNTIVIFTSDHATYQDDSFNTAFPDYERDNVAIDRIPLFVFYKGVGSGHINVKGRNSLDLAPTILDMLNISAPNYFIGTSLFSEEADNICEFCFTDSNMKYTTRDGNIRKLEGNELEEFDRMLKEYYITNETH